MANQLEQGIAAFESGDRATAFILFRDTVREEPNSSAAWYWMSTVIEDPARQRDCLERSLQLDSSNQLALDALRKLSSPTSDPASDLPQTPSVRPASVESSLNVESADHEKKNRFPTSDPAISVIDPELERETRLEALAELEPQPLKTDKKNRRGTSKDPSRKRSIWIWILGAVVIMVVLIAGMALITYSNLPRYEALVPLLASVGPKAINTGGVSSTLDATAQAALPALNLETPLFDKDQWKLEPIYYEKKDLGNGQSELIVDLVLENHSPYLGAITISSEGTVRAGDGREFKIGFGYEPKMLILPGIRLQSVDETHNLRLSVNLPTDSDDYRLIIPYKIELLNLENSLVSTGEGEFDVDAPQILLGQPSMFLVNDWENYRQEPPPGVFAVEPGIPADFGFGKMTVEGLRKSGINGGTNTDYDWTLKSTLINPSSEVNLTLNTRFPGFVMLYRSEQWGKLIPPEVSIKTLSADPGRTTLADVWSLNAQNTTMEQPETWCSLGLYDAISGDQHKNLVVVSCLPVTPP